MKRKYKLKLSLLILLLGVGYILLNLDNSMVVEFPVIEKITKDDIGQRLDDTRKFVETALQEKEQVNKDKALMERAERAYHDATDIYNGSVKEYNLTLDAMGLYGNGSLEIFLEVATERGLISKLVAVE